MVVLGAHREAVQHQHREQVRERLLSRTTRCRGARPASPDPAQTCLGARWEPQPPNTLHVFGPLSDLGVAGFDPVFGVTDDDIARAGLPIGLARAAARALTLEVLLGAPTFTPATASLYGRFHPQNQTVHTPRAGPRWPGPPTGQPSVVAPHRGGRSCPGGRARLGA